jgi:peptide/nickel transport system substrate-binding protein
VTVVVSNDILSHDPNRQLENVTWSVLGNVYEPLVEFDAELRARPALARSWRQPSPERWRFELRPAVFHDGTPVSAGIVAECLRRVRDSPEHEAAQYLSPIRGIEVVDERTLDLDTGVPRALLANLAVVGITKPNASPGFPPLVGTGPYALKEWAAGRRITLELFPGFSGPAPAVRRAVFEPVPDVATRLRRIQAGSADLTEDVPPAQARTPLPGLRFVKRDGLTLYYLGLDTREAPGNPFRDARVRRAFHAAIDRRDLVTSVLEGLGQVATQPAPQRVFGFDPSLPEPVFDPDAARRLLSEAGQTGLQVRLDVGQDRVDVAERLAQQLAAVGVRLAVNAVPRERVYELGEQGQSRLYLMGWNFVSGESSEFLEYCLHSPRDGLGLTNYGAYSNRRLDRIAEENPGVLDPVARQALLFEAARLAMQELPVLPLYVTHDIYAVRDGLRFQPRAGSALRLGDLGFGP